MKIIHLTDSHLLGENQNIFGINVKERFINALKSIKQNHSDAKFIVITGDLVHDEKIKSYEILKDLIKDFKIPIHFILGNHDKKTNFNKVFSLCKNDDYVQYVKEYENNIFIFLDTSIENQEYGNLCEDRLKWLNQQLDKNKNKKIYIFMHHFPLNSKLPWMEKNASFKNKDKFWEIVSKYENIKHIFTGHLHRIINANYNGIGVSCTRSTTFQIAYTPNSDNDCLTNIEKPTYAIVDIDETSVLIHNHEYLDEDNLYIPDAY